MQSLLEARFKMVTHNGELTGRGRCGESIRQGKTVAFGLTSIGRSITVALLRGGEMNPTGAVWILVTLLGALVAAQQAKPRFEVASVRRNTSVDSGWSSNQNPGAYNIRNATLQAIVRIAYGVRDDQILGGPGWLQTDRFDVVAKANPDAPSPQLTLMIQSLLEDRFKLVVRREQRDMPVFTLTLNRSDGRLGPGLTRVDECRRSNPVFRAAPNAPAGAGMFGGCGASAAIAGMVSQHLQATVIDKTGLTGTYEMSVFYAPDDVTSPSAASVSDLPSFPAALQEQLGLKLESTRGQVNVLVIDSVEPPSEN